MNTITIIIIAIVGIFILRGLIALIAGIITYLIDRRYR